MSNDGLETTHPKSSASTHALRLFRMGLVASVAYIGTLAAYAWSEWSAMLAMKPDQFATFLSGVFAPLAFLWLVLGFRQQGDELQNSARALWLQGEELRNSVEQQRQLVEVSRQQLLADQAKHSHEEVEAERAAQPLLTMSDVGGSYSGPKRALTFRVTNGGRTCADVELYFNASKKAVMPFLPEGANISCEIIYETPEQVEPVTINVLYTDQRGNRRGQQFAIPVSETGGPNGDRTLGRPRKLPEIFTNWDFRKYD